MRSAEPVKLRRSWLALAASSIRSSSSSRCRANSATTCFALRRRPSLQSRSMSAAALSRISTSLAISASTPGLRTLTATSRPSVSTPRWTCAIEALATGSRSKLANSSVIGRPSEASISARASSAANGGTRSCSFASSSAMSSGTRSRRVDSTCPNFTKIGPSVSSASRRRCPRGSPRWPESAPSSALLASGGTNSCSPNRRPTLKMRSRRRSLPKVTHPALERLEASLQRLQLFAQPAELMTGHERAVFPCKIADAGLHQAPPGIALPGEKIAPGLHQPARRDVADEPRQILFHVPSQMLQQKADGVSQGLLARNGPCSRSHMDDGEPDGVGRRGFEEPGRGDPATQHEGAAACLHYGAGEGGEPLARPRLLLQKLVDDGNGRVRRKHQEKVR